MIVSLWRNLWCLTVGKKSTSSFTLSLRICKDIADLLFWEFWAWLAMHTQKDTIKLKKIFLFIVKQKIKILTHVFQGDIAKICKLLILGTLGMPAYAHPKWYYQIVENFDVYLHAINTLHHSLCLEILNFKEPCNLIGWQHFGP